MKICAYGWKNLALTGILSTDDSAYNLPISNLTDPHGAPARGWRTRSGTANFTITLQNGQIATWNVLSFHRANFSQNFLLNITVYRGEQNVLTTGWVACSCRGGQAIMVFEKTEGTSLKIEINDHSNPDGFLSIPLCFAGNIWQPERNFSTQSTKGITIGEQVTSSLSGAEFVEPYYTQRVATIVHQSLGNRDLLTINQIIRTASADQNILFIPDPDAAYDVLAETAIFGRLSCGDVSNPYGVADRHAATFTIKERL
ncbi:hypothetical protein [Aristophania vespae]|uniref:hypothetical protein n=1 Tax=Aristophania vespae TaxID=2697033 RepID=UPI00235139B2|nr:hypothetical protein [Aristophania vespae]UMM63093.1 hypothetical protein DM15PD_00470 [Aristophania vespae]